jgi:Fic family protein
MGDWPAHQVREVAWKQAYRSGPREDRMLTSVTVHLPPHITVVPLTLDGPTMASMEAAAREITALDREQRAELGALGATLLRTESVASSKIERIEASSADYARALHGNRSNRAATSMAAATTAIEALIASANDASIEIDGILSSHATLMRDDPAERTYAGRFRDVQNWIGGSDHSPRNAVYVPPPPDDVSNYMADLVTFCNRVDLPAMAQAALAHAQFESIHPFTDGNGRIGRALINAVLRRRGVTRHLIVPLASALVAHRDRYFDLLDEYRQGRASPIIVAFSDAAQISAAASRETALRLRELPQEWRDAIGRVRRGSATDRLLAWATQVAAFTAEEAHDSIGGPLSSVYTAIERMTAAGIVHPLTDRQRNQVWGVTAVLDELDELGARIARNARRRSPPG